MNQKEKQPDKVCCVAGEGFQLYKYYGELTGDNIQQHLLKQRF